VSEAATADSRRRTLWPWLVLGAFLIGVLAMRLLGAFVSASNLPVLTVVPSFALVDQTGDAFHSHELSGRVWIASFIYTSCPGPCPRVVQRVAEVERQLGAEPDFSIVSFSVDPQADTPDVLAAYGRTHGIDASRWTLATGAVDDVTQLVRRGFLQAVEKNATETRATEGAVVHSLHLVLVDRSMQVRGYYDSSDPAAMKRLVEDARRLLRSSRA
jgi:protein SCO1/2